MPRNIEEAAKRIKDMDTEEMHAFVRHDPDIFRDVATTLQAALSTHTAEGGEAELLDLLTKKIVVVRAVGSSGWTDEQKTFWKRGLDDALDRVSAMVTAAMRAARVRSQAPVVGAGGLAFVTCPQCSGNGAEVTTCVGGFKRCQTCNGMGKVIREKDTPTPDARAVAEGMLWRHKKRGTIYREIGVARIQASIGSLHEGDEITIYRAETDGVLWARPVAEFHDGRFEQIVALPQPPAGGVEG